MKISTAYDAFWFLMDHPKMRCRWAHLLSPEEAKSYIPNKGERLRTVKDTMPWKKDIAYTLREFSSYTEALKVNLSIFFTRVDEHGKINDDATKNVNVECWLEFGPIRQAVSDGDLHIMHFHDLNLDCGAPTFEEALVKLARKVKRHYGDFPAPKWTLAKKKHKAST